MPVRAVPRLLPALLLLVVVLPATVLHADSGREQQLAERLQAADRPGESVWLETGADKFLALHHAALGALPRQAVLLVHGMGGHPDWPEVIAPLRTGLPQHGWSTLSLQMPLLAPRALADDYGGTVAAAGRRIDSGIDYLRRQGYSRVVILGYGFGASQALAYLGEKNDGQNSADGLIMVSVLAREFLQPALELTDLLAALELPVLDIYGRNDFPEVRDKARLRRQAMSPDSDFSQHAVAGADHYFTAVEQRLLMIIVGWLEQTFAERADNAYDMKHAGHAVTSDRRWQAVPEVWLMSGSTNSNDS